MKINNIEGTLIKKIFSIGVPKKFPRVCRGKQMKKFENPCSKLKEVDRIIYIKRVVSSWIYGPFRQAKAHGSDVTLRAIRNIEKSVLRNSSINMGFHMSNIMPRQSLCMQ